MSDDEELNEILREAREKRVHHEMIHSLQSRLNEQRNVGEKFADVLVRWFGTTRFFVAHAIFFVFWILANLHLIPKIDQIFDPYPFNLLTMVVSLEAIFLSIFVLMSQNRETKIAELRQELDFQVNMIAEQEVTKIIHLLASIMQHLKVPYEKDPELRRMMRPLNVEEIRKRIEQELHLSAPS